MPNMIGNAESITVNNEEYIHQNPEDRFLQAHDDITKDILRGRAKSPNTTLRNSSDKMTRDVRVTDE